MRLLIDSCIFRVERGSADRKREACLQNLAVFEPIHVVQVCKIRYCFQSSVSQHASLEIWVLSSFAIFTIL